MTFGDEDRSRYYIAVDDGESEAIRAWKVSPSPVRGPRAGRRDHRAAHAEPLLRPLDHPSREHRLLPDRLAAVTAPKRFPERTPSPTSAPRPSRIEPGGELDETRRLAGRVMARREMGKLVFLDLVDRSGRMQLMCDTGRIGDVDVHLGDVVGVVGTAREVAARRAVARGRRADGARAGTAARSPTRSTASPTSRRGTASATSTCS